MLGLRRLICLVAGAAWLGGGAVASAQELSIPVMVQTRPEIPGARFALNGAEFVANQYGLAVTTVPEPGTYELTVLSPRIDAEEASHSFSLWAGGERASSRPLEVISFTLLEAGFDTARQVTFDFTDQSGDRIEPERIGQATIVELDGEPRYRIDGEQPKTVLASRAVGGATGVALEPASYGLLEAVVDGRRVSNPETIIEIGVDSAVGIPVAIAGEQGSVNPGAPAAQSQENGTGGVPWSVPAVLVGLIAIGCGVWLWRSLGSPGWQWPSMTAVRESKAWLGGIRTAEQSDAGLEAQRASKKHKTEERGSGGNHHLRVHMKNGQIVDGWSDATMRQGQDQVVDHLRVENAYNESGMELKSVPKELALLASEITSIQHIDSSTAPPPSNRFSGGDNAASNGEGDPSGVPDSGTQEHPDSQPRKLVSLPILYLVAFLLSVIVGVLAASVAA